jgi:hypothetical protein
MMMMPSDDSCQLSSRATWVTPFYMPHVAMQRNSSLGFDICILSAVSHNLSVGQLRFDRRNVDRIDCLVGRSLSFTVCFVNLQ